MDHCDLQTTEGHCMNAFRSSREREAIRRRLDSTKWALIGKCSQDTALRDIGDLMEHGILARQEAGGRSTSYQLVMPRP